MSNFGEALHYEVKDKVDLLVWNAGGIKTKIFEKGGMDLERVDKLQSNNCIFATTQQAVDGMLKDLGRSAVTEGPCKHEFLCPLFHCAKSCTPCFGARAAKKVEKDFAETRRRA